MLTMTTTGLVVFIVLLALALYDFAMVVFKGTNGSVSQFLIRTAFKSPMVSFGFGMCSGHLFMYMYLEGCEPHTADKLLSGLAGAGIYAGLYEIIKQARKSSTGSGNRSQDH